MLPKTYLIMMTGMALFFISCADDAILEETNIEELTPEDTTDDTMDEPIGETVTSYPQFPGNVFFNGDLREADYWSEEPEILSAGLGFCNIVGIPVDQITEEVVREAGGAWRADVDCTDLATRTFANRLLDVSTVFVVQTPYNELKDGAIGLDAMPVVFSWPVLTNTIDLSDFRITLNTGEVITPTTAGVFPNVEVNERNVVVLAGEFANKLSSDNPEARFPVKCEIVADATPLTLLGPNNQSVSAVGLTWETTSNPFDENNGPRLVGAKLNFVGDEAIGEGTGNAILDQQNDSNDEFTLYGGGDFRLRMLTSGGFSPDGVGAVLPTDFEKFFRIHVKGENGTTILIEESNKAYQVLGGTLQVLGLSDLGAPEGGGITYDDCYQEDGDNYIDIILIGDEQAARNIEFLEIPSLTGGYSAFSNPGGPGSTPFPGEIYTQPGPPDMEPVRIALDNPMRVSN